MENIIFLHQTINRETPLKWQIAGLQQTASGYGARLTTRRMVKHLGRWRRVYCSCYGNSGSCFITVKGQRITVLD